MKPTIGNFFTAMFFANSAKSIGLYLVATFCGYIAYQDYVQDQETLGAVILAVAIGFFWLMNAGSWIVEYKRYKEEVDRIVQHLKNQ